MEDGPALVGRLNMLSNPPLFFFAKKNVYYHVNDNKRSITSMYTISCGLKPFGKNLNQDWFGSLNDYHVSPTQTRAHRGLKRDDIKK